MFLKCLRLSAAGVVGLLAYFIVAERPLMEFLYRKAAGQEPCPWSNLPSLPWDIERLVQLKESYAKQIQPLATDDKHDIVQFSTPTRSFWIKKEGERMDGRALLASVLAEEEWIMAKPKAQPVQPGDVVLDVGAHIGSFGDDALRRGAKKVIMVEPDPVNVECIRRNFAAEIASGKVVVIPEGAWSSESVLSFSMGKDNSGMGSFVIKASGSRTIDVPVRPIDEMLRRAGIDKVDFIKFDIEGAEREALKGAAQTLARMRPRIMLDSYHLPDDSTVLPAVILSANPAYRSECALCNFAEFGEKRQLVPYAVFYR